MPKPFEKLPHSPPLELAENGCPSCQEFTIEQRRILLGIAHEAILSKWAEARLAHPPISPELEEPRGVFTTLYLCNEAGGNGHRQLRGCVGYAMPLAPLFMAVAETARAAAFEDSRFLPVTLPEAERVEVSLSVLSRLFPIHPEAVQIGRHGLLISDGARRGLLLPQVPVERGWDRETFLEQTCHKAGLPADAWRKSATVQAFTAEVFCDTDVRSSA